ncbi:putative nuclease HARBI1 [Hydractinia symbiolongicarpus]|uniref:putative nuclease HARBI1 n=1 Tax=Hydractinia symbiolongicarpus TaxID=13093 RepID=UPI002550CBE3|nr:putative nuclease HARBI1 [Hydractinia symbiolongicarpus]
MSETKSFLDANRNLLILKSNTSNRRATSVLVTLSSIWVVSSNCIHYVHTALQYTHYRTLLTASLLSGSKRNCWIKKQKALKEQRKNRIPRSTWFKQGRVEQWWLNMFFDVLPEEDWKKNFRMTKAMFTNLVDQIRIWITPDNTSPNYRALSAEKKVAVTLYYLKDTGSLSMTANTFGLHISTVSKVIRDVCNCITYKLGPKYIALPKTKEEMLEKVGEFEAKFGMTQAFGCIDGTHVQILRPSEHSQDYFSYKMYFSLNVQAVCDFRGYFMDVDCRWPGSVHDAKVFANSNIAAKLKDEEIPITYEDILPGRAKVPNYLIGDPAYPLTPYCMKEYHSCSTNAQVLFNNMLRSARNPVECAFGRLKARWGFLAKKVDLKIDFVPVAIYACFVLHNICELNKCVIDPDLVKIEIEKHKAETQQLDYSVYLGNLAEGDVVREAINII